MKICPSCRETYADDDLNFCLKDGSFLTTAAGNEPKTIYMDSTRVTNPNWQQQQPPNYQPPAVWQNTQNSVQNQQFTNQQMRIYSQDQTLPTISLILGILGVLVACCHGGIPLGIGAIVTGVIALNQEKNDPTKYGGRSLAMAGIITGAVGIAVGFGFLLMIIFAN